MSSTDEFQARLLATFRIEAIEHLDSLGAGLLSLEQSDEPQPEVLEVVFRDAHSLKGAARAVGMVGIEQLCQAVEALLSDWKKGRYAPDRAAFDLLQRCVDQLRDLAEGPMDQPSMQTPVLLEELEAARGGASSAPATPAPPAPPPTTPTVEPRAITAPTPDPVVPATPSPEPAVPAAPSPEPPPAPTPGQVEHSAAPTAAPRGAPSTQPAARTPPKSAPSTVRIQVERLDELLLRIEGTVAAKLEATELSTELRELEARIQAIARKLGRPGTTPNATHLAAVRSDLEEVDEHAQRITRTANQHQRDLSRMVDSLLEDTKRLAMQPFQSLLDSYPRMLRDIARQEGKELVMRVDGGSVEIDKRILDELKDPLTHILRNAADHGIESPEERERQGKEPRGLIHVAIEQVDSSAVELRIEDDGKGLQIGRIRQVAVDRGFLDRDSANEADDHSIGRLVFESGLSSAPIVTDISGHGLGLAIVRQKVEQLGGRIDVASEPGEGTRFTIHLPLTLATFRGVLAEVDGRRFIVPGSAVERVVRVDQEGISTVESRETVVLDGRVIPMVRLEQVLELPRRSLPGVHQQYVQLLVLRRGDNLVGFGVDKVLHEQEVLVKPLGSKLTRVRNVSGASVLASGEVVPILNVPDMVASAEKIRAISKAKGQTERGKQRQRVLIAEDSITSRMLLKNILESAGYDVTTAVDGAEAFATLRSEDFDVLVSDVEMPRMNGFELTERVRADTRLAQLPVILVTALGSREHREQGIDVGANAYIVKSSFDHSNLLETVARFL
jgi:two-component system chemotaxis sensor kinase CheA